MRSRAGERKWLGTCACARECVMGEADACVRRTDGSRCWQSERAVRSFIFARRKQHALIHEMTRHEWRRYIQTER
eukprot:3844150-Pleurochrysis_carterae.AAC.1